MAQTPIRESESSEGRENRDTGGRSPEKSEASSSGITLDRLAHDVTTKMSARAEDLSRRANDYVANTRNYVKDHPLQSVAIAAASGLAVGTILSIVSRRNH